MRVPAGAPAEVQQAFREVWTAIDPLVGPRAIDLRGRRVVNATDGLASTDYATVGQLTTGLQAVRPATLTAPSGAALPVTYGTHAERLAAAPLLFTNRLFFETDRLALYGVRFNSSGTPGTPTWRLLSVDVYPNLAANRPGDLTVEDNGYQFWAGTDLGWSIYWTGGAWHMAFGIIYDTHANRPLVFPSPSYSSLILDVEVKYVETDRGGQMWTIVYDAGGGTSGWRLVKGVGVPHEDTLANIPATLGTNDAGFRFKATDFDRVYRWSGSAWADDPGQPSRGMIAYFDNTNVVAPGTGWALCDGSTVTISTATGGSASKTVPNLTGSNRFLRSVSGTTGGTGGSATTHTHQVDPPNTTSTTPSTNTTGTPSASVEVQAGAGSTVSAVAHTHDMASHTHDVNIAAFASAGPSGASGDDANPNYLNARPYMRL